MLSNNFFSTFRTHTHRSFEMVMDEDHVDKSLAAYKSHDASNTAPAGAAAAGVAGVDEGNRTRGENATAAEKDSDAQIGGRSRGSRKRSRSTDADAAAEAAPTPGADLHPGDTAPAAAAGDLKPQPKRRTLSLLHRAVSTVDPSVVGDSTAISQRSAITPHEALMFAYALSYRGNILGGSITVSANAFADDEEDDDDQPRRSRGGLMVKRPPRVNSLRHNLRGEADAPSVTVKF